MINICYLINAAFRMLVYEYVNNGNLEQWLHGDVGPCSPLTWEIRMNIVLGCAKGYASVDCENSLLLLAKSILQILFSVITKV